MTRHLLVGLVGAHIQHSLSPALHEDAFAATNIHGFYHLMDLEVLRGRCLEELIEAVRVAGFAGINVTYPCKEAILPLLDALSAEAREIGAVNTVTIAADGSTTGHNTDRSGFRRSFEKTFGRTALDGKEALLVGAGGAGRAVAFALFDLGVTILHAYDRDETRAQDLAESLAAVFGTGRCCVAAEPSPPPAAAGIVTATPIGMVGHPGCAVPLSAIEARHFVADVIYTPLETELIKGARARGARVMGGAGMCVHQAADAFRLFTGLAPDLERMRRTFAAAAALREAAMDDDRRIAADRASP